MLLMLGCTVGCDQTTKHMARRELGERGFITLPGGFGELRLAENPGSFLSLGDSLPKLLRLAIFTIGTGIGLLCLLWYLVFGGWFNWLVFVGLGLVWAGGMSNMIDRISRHGLVSDFIFIQVGPFHTGIFNIADFVILIGVTAIACDLWLRRNKQAQKQAKEDQP